MRQCAVILLAVYLTACASAPEGTKPGGGGRADAMISSSCHVRGGGCSASSTVALRARTSDKERSIALVELEVDRFSAGADCAYIMSMDDDKDDAPNLVRQDIRLDCSRCAPGSYVRLRGKFADDRGDTSRLDCSIQTSSGF